MIVVMTVVMMMIVVMIVMSMCTDQDVGLVGLYASHQGL